MTLLLLPIRSGRAAPTGDPQQERHLPLTEVFPTWELGTLAASAAAAAGLSAAAWRWGDQVTPAIDPPAEGSIDRRASAAFAGHQDDPLLWDLPNRGAWVMALLPAALYGSSTLVLAGRDHGWLGPGDINPQLRLVASSEALIATLLLNQAVKLSVGRTRPRNVIDGQPAAGDHEAQLSFFSMHTALSFTAASFLTLDLGNRLPLAGRIGLATALYGLAGLIGFSRVYDQAHFLSDVLVGAAVGTLSGTAFYLLHFTLDGRPRVADATSGTTQQPLARASRGPDAPAGAGPLLLSYGFTF